MPPYVLGALHIDTLWAKSAPGTSIDRLDPEHRADRAELVQDERFGLVPLDPEAVHRHAPLVTMLRYGKRSRRADLGVRVQVTYTEVGTLEVWCVSRDGAHRWKLDLNIRERDAA